jgi:predicted type IV restriction endonuclease
MKEQLEQYVKQVRDWHQDCRGNEEATKQSLIAPLFTALGYDMKDPRECKPEYRTDFGKGERAAMPVDWAFLINGSFAFFVEAKEAGAKLPKYAEQLGMYFAKEPAVKLGILTNGVEWHFFTDLEHVNVMDREPFLVWKVLGEEAIPLDFLTLLQKSGFKQQLVRTFAEQGRRQSLLLDKLTRLLEPSEQFTKLLIKDLETRNLVPRVIEEWKPILAGAIDEWVRQKMLEMTLQPPEKVHPVKPGGTRGTGKRKGAAVASHSLRHRLRFKFWAGLLDRARAKTPLHENISPGEYNWVGTSSGVRGLNFNYSIRKGEGMAELYIDRGPEEPEANKRIFDDLLGHKDEVEQAFGGGLSWQRLDDSRGCRIAYTTKAGGWKTDEAKWPAIQDAMIDAMVRLEKALRPQLDKLKAKA